MAADDSITTTPNPDEFQLLEKISIARKSYYVSWSLNNEETNQKITNCALGD